MKSFLIDLLTTICYYNTFFTKRRENTKSDNQKNKKNNSISYKIPPENNTLNKEIHSLDDFPKAEEIRAKKKG